MISNLKFQIRIAILGLLCFAAVPTFADEPKTDSPKADVPKTDSPKPDAPPASSPQSPASSEPAGPKLIQQALHGAVVLDARDVMIHGKTVRYEPPPKNTIGYWSDPTEWVSWEFQLDRPKKFTVQMLHGCGKGSGGSQYAVEVAGQKLEDLMPDTGSFHTFKLRTIGVITIDKPGKYTLSVKPANKTGIAVMDLRRIYLIPVEEKPKPDEKSKPADNSKDAPKKDANPTP